MEISQIRQQKNIISFKSDNQVNPEKFSDADLYRMASTSDVFLQQTAMRDEAQKFKQDPMRSVEEKTAKAIPIADTLLSAALTPGNFGDKMFAGLKTAGFWTVFTGITNKLSKKLNQNETYRNFSQEHPAMASLVGSLAVVTVGGVGWIGLKMGFNKLVGMYKPASDFIQSIKNSLSQNHVGKTISDFADKNRKFTAIAGVAALVGVVGLVINNLVSLARIKNNADKETEQYKNIRLEASQELNNRLLDEQVQRSE